MTTDRERLLRRGDYIGGSFVTPERVDGYVVGVNPGDRSDVLGRFPFSETSVDEAMSAAGKGALIWRKIPMTDRANAVRRYREALGRFQERFAELLTRETGKPLWESRQEVVAAIRAVDLLLEDGLVLLQPRGLDEREARSDYRPRGVVAVIAPYNFPLLIPTLQIAAALLSGNTVVFKPSKFTPGCGQMIGEMMDRCRLPRGVFNFVQGSGSGIGSKLVVHPGLDALLFSGSFATAMAIRRATFERPELPTLYQCGGKGCAIVLDDADINRSVYEVLVGAFLTAGQRHNSTGRVIVTRGIFDAFIERLVRQAGHLNIGYGFDDDTFLGPVISENFRGRVRRFGRQLVQAGHPVLLAGGNREVEGHKGFYVAPAIYQIQWSKGQAVLEDEPPGPTLMVYKVDAWDEAVLLHNQLVYRASTSLFTDPESPELDEVASRLKTGSLNVNRGTIGASLRLPAVGLGRSSNGIPAGIDLLRFLSTPRSTLVERRPFDPAQSVPGTNWDRGEFPDLSGSLMPEKL